MTTVIPPVFFHVVEDLAEWVRALPDVFPVEMADDLTKATDAATDVFAVLIEFDRTKTAHALAYILAVDIVQYGPEAVQTLADIFAVNIVGYLAKAAHAPSDIFIRQHDTRSFIVLGDGGVRPSRRGLVATAGLFISLDGVVVPAACEAGGIGKCVGGPQFAVFAHAAFAVVIFRHRITTSYMICQEFNALARIG